MNRPIVGVWCTSMWFACHVLDDAAGMGKYLRNYGKVFDYMQSTPLDLDGGTYFPTKQDAIDCVERYNAAQNQDDTCNTKETTNQTNNIEKQETE